MTRTNKNSHIHRQVFWKWQVLSLLGNRCCVVKELKKLRWQKAFVFQRANLIHVLWIWFIKSILADGMHGLVCTVDNQNYNTEIYVLFTFLLFSAERIKLERNYDQQIDAILSWSSWMQSCARSFSSLFCYMKEFCHYISRLYGEFLYWNNLRFKWSVHYQTE